MRVGYRRVSSAGQNLDRQELPGVEKVFEDKASGKDTARPGLEAMLDFVREGDEVVVHSLDRLGRSLKDLQAIVERINAKGASVHFIKEGLHFEPDGNDPMGRLLFQVLGAFAEFERALIRERQREGIEKAKKAGKHMGRPRKVDCSEVQQKAIPMLENGKSKAEVAEMLGISRATLYRCLEGVLVLQKPIVVRKRRKK